MSKWHFRRSRDSSSSRDSPSYLSDDIEAFIKPSDPPNLSRLFCDAAEFHKVLACSDCIDPRRSDSDDSNAFADLVGRDLDSSEQAAAGHVARLRATRYSWGSQELTAEPESYDQAKEGDSEEHKKHSIGPTITSTETEDDKLDPAQIINILIEEFGPLASDDVQEKLVFETDGCIICHEVFIIVQFIFHLTRDFSLRSVASRA